MSDYTLKHPVLTVSQQFQSSWSNVEVSDPFLIDCEQTGGHESSFTLLHRNLSFLHDLQFFFTVCIF